MVRFWLVVLYFKCIYCYNVSNNLIIAYNINNLKDCCFNDNLNSGDLPVTLAPTPRMGPTQETDDRVKVCQSDCDYKNNANGMNLFKEKSTDNYFVFDFNLTIKHLGNRCVIYLIMNLICFLTFLYGSGFLQYILMWCDFSNELINYRSYQFEQCESIYINNVKCLKS